MHFDYCPNCTQRPVALTQDVFEKLISQPWLKAICDEISTGNLDRKRDLPAVCWQAAFGGEKRSNQTAKPSGLFALDIDHVDNPEELFKTFCNRINELGIYIVHKTPSTHGLRVVARCRPEFETIADNQDWLSREINVEHDACTRDFARLSFIVPKSYFYHYNASVFTDVAETYPQAETLKKEFSSNTINETSENSGSTLPSNLSFKGVSYADIVNILIERTGGQPVEGERNNRLYLICRLLANITDRQPDKLFQICPRFGLSEQEVRACCESACKSARTEKIPFVLYNILRDLGIENNKSSVFNNEDVVEEFEKIPDLTHLPPLIREFVSTSPEDFKAATIFVCLPIVGFLGSRLRSKYLDGETQAPSFIVNVVAPAASGKGTLLRISDICLKKVRAMDDEGREQEMEYQRLMKLNKNQKKQVEEPKPIVRDIPAKVSVAMLLKRMVQARGLHLISISAEADTITNSNKSGAWAQKSDIYRISQDGAGGRYGQDYKSDASFSATCEMRYNLLTLGTPGSIARLYPDVEDGLITRCVIVDLPSQFGKPMPVRKQLTAKQMSVIEERVNALMAICQDSDGNILPEYFINLNWLNDGIKEWLTQQQLKAIRDEDHARDQFMRRAALIAFRAGLVASFLWGKRLSRKQKEYTLEFTIWVGDFVLSTLLNRYSGKINEQNRQYEVSTRKRYPSLFEALNDVFTLFDLQREARVLGLTSPTRSIIHRWSVNNLIEKQGDNYVKLKK